jgi:hypothetical protein
MHLKGPNLELESRLNPSFHDSFRRQGEQGKKMKLSHVLTAILFCLFALPGEAYRLTPEHSYLLSQNAEDEAYDPFSDYSEFDEASDEEADINFFRNGRFITVGFVLGFKGFTDNLVNIYQPSGTYGLFLSYFFDLKVALQFGFSTGDYPFSFCTASAQCNSGNVSFTFLQMAVKFYFNTQNVTKGVADLNPYAIGGFSNVMRTYTVASSVTGSLSNARDSTFGLDVGAGIEIPMLRKKGFFGVQFTFHYASFSDAGSTVFLSDFGQAATQTPYGYQYDLLGIIGVNF